MKTKRKVLTVEEIDRIVISQTEEKLAWEKPIKVKKPKPAYVSLPKTLAARASFFARLHREKKMENWLFRIIQERLEIEEAAFAWLKKHLLATNNS